VEMKSKQSIVFNKVKDLYCPYIERWFYPDFEYPHQFKLEAISISPEHYHIIANAANKFYELVTLNE
jgi:hypothetical protein